MCLIQVTTCWYANECITINLCQPKDRCYNQCHSLIKWNGIINHQQIALPLEPHLHSPHRHYHQCFQHQVAQKELSNTICHMKHTAHCHKSTGNSCKSSIHSFSFCTFSLQPLMHSVLRSHRFGHDFTCDPPQQPDNVETPVPSKDDSLLFYSSSWSHIHSWARRNCPRQDI